MIAIRLLAPFFGALAFAPPAFAVDTLRINEHAVNVDADTVVIVDGETLPAGSPLPDKPGLRVEARFAAMAKRPATPGGIPAATTVVFSYAVRGPVTSTAPLRVLGQEVTVTADTGMAGVPGGAIGNIAIGDHLDASGYVDANASLLASFIEYLPSGTPRWLLSGYVTAIDGDEARIGPQRVGLAGVAPIDCGDALAVGAFVEIRADAIAGFGSDSLLDSVTRLTCVAPVPIGTPGALGALTGIVGEILAPGTFTFGPYTVTFDAATEFRFGSADDLAPGVAIEVDGTFGDNAAFTAQGIQFDAPAIRLEGPILPGDVVPGADGTVEVLGKRVRRSAQLRDRDALYEAGIDQPRQVEVRGWVDRLGQLWAARARLRGSPDPGDARAGGPLDAVAPPLMSVLGLTLDSSGATFEDPAGNIIDADAFFALALPGALVEQSGAWDGVDTLSGGVVALIAPLDVSPPALAVTQPALIVGTLRAGDALFGDGFD